MEIIFILKQVNGLGCGLDRRGVDGLSPPLTFEVPYVEIPCSQSNSTDIENIEILTLLLSTFEF